MGSKSVVDLMEASSGAHFSGFHMDTLKQRIKEIDTSTTSATENMHKQPFVIGKGWMEIYSNSVIAFERQQMVVQPYHTGSITECPKMKKIERHTS